MDHITRPLVRYRISSRSQVGSFWWLTHREAGFETFGCLFLEGPTKLRLSEMPSNETPQLLTYPKGGCLFAPDFLLSTQPGTGLGFPVASPVSKANRPLTCWFSHVGPVLAMVPEG